MFSWAQKRTNYWSKIRKKAPKVPDITCPAIDDVLNQLEKQISKEFKDPFSAKSNNDFSKLSIIF